MCECVFIPKQVFSSKIKAKNFENPKDCNSNLFFILQFGADFLLEGCHFFKSSERFKLSREFSLRETQIFSYTEIFKILIKF